MENLFSPREMEVIPLLMQGKSNKEIAAHLVISIRTVETHLGSIYSKLGITSRTEAVIKLSEHPLWKSTIEEHTNNWGNPQLKTGPNSAILTSKTKVVFQPIRRRRIKIKNFARIVIVFLIAAICVVLVIGFFALLRQM